MNALVKGSGGGGGKGGGGSSHVATEAPNTLKSIQYAKVLDLVSEGEIQGLVNGLQSVYLDGTSIRNSDGTNNFSGFSFDYRNGIQNQTYINGFSDVESEIDVSTEVTYYSPVVRTITNSDVNSVRLTVSVPTLTQQDTSNGDLNGSSVTLQVYYNNNGGSWYPAPVSINTSSLYTYVTNTNKTITSAINGNTISTSVLRRNSGVTYVPNSTVTLISANIAFTWIGIVKTKGNLFSPIVDTTPQVANWLLEYRLTPSGSWTTLQTGQVTGITGTEYNSDPDAWSTTKFVAPSVSTSIDWNAPSEGIYEFRVSISSGVGSVGFNYVNANSYSPNVVISGKTVSNYQRAVRFNLPQPGPWDIKVVRVTPDSNSSALQNKTYFSSYTEIIDAKLSYPNSAVFGLQIDATQFSSIPTRGYEIYGIKIKVPSNYNPSTRKYTGAWDGSFNVAWSNNPAWVFYDLVTNDRYGLGNFIDTSAVDKWGLYTIAQYCDELIPDGFGGYEPRFTCNAYIQNRSEAYSLITQVASAFRAMIYWSAGQITCIQDKPSDTVALFTASNIIDGQFNYSGSSVKTRHTVCLVTWNDPSDKYKAKVEYVEDPDGIKLYGVISTDITAFGCTSRGQAHRLGRWLLYSERLEGETVTFKAGMDTALIYPGAIIHTQDQYRSGKRFGGRLTSGSTTTLLNIDSSVTIESGKTYEVSVILPDGSLESSPITNLSGDTTALNLSTALSSVPINNAIWVLAASDLTPEEWRVISITESEPGVVEISALSSRQDKFDAVEKDLILQPLKTTAVDTAIQAVTNFKVVESLYLVSPVVVGNSAILSWTSTAPRFIVSYTADNINPVTIESLEASYTFTGLAAGTYTFIVQPVNILGQRGASVSQTVQLYGLTNPPADVSNLSMNAVSSNAHITFDAATDLDVLVGGYLRLRYSRSSTSWNDAVDLGVYIPGTATSAVVPLMQGNYLAKWVDSSGIESVNAVAIEANSPSILNLNMVLTLAEQPAFAGTKTNIGISNYLGTPCITLDSSTTIDSMLDYIDTWPTLDSLGGTSTSGAYIFSEVADLGNVYTSRLTADMVSIGINTLDKVDNWGLIDNILSIDGNVVNDVSAQLYVKYSNDNITYSDWIPFFVGDYTARYFQFKLGLSSSSSSNILVTTLQVNIDMPDTIYTGNDIISGVGTYTVTYPTPFYAASAVGITAQNMQTGDYYTVTTKSNSGFSVTFYNSSGTIISRTFDYIVKGY